MPGVAEEALRVLARSAAGPNLGCIWFESAVATDALVDDLAACTNLSTLGLHGWSLTDRGLSRLASACLSLTIVDLTYTGVSDAGILELVTQCKGLEQINLMGVQSITAAAIRSIAHSCEKLEVIDLSHTTLVVYDAISYLIRCVSYARLC